jgi:hypothetical protein
MTDTPPYHQQSTECSYAEDNTIDYDLLGHRDQGHLQPNHHTTAAALLGHSVERQSAIDTVDNTTRSSENKFRWLFKRTLPKNLLSSKISSLSRVSKLQLSRLAVLIAVLIYDGTYGVWTLITIPVVSLVTSNTSRRLLIAAILGDIHFCMGNCSVI